MFIQYTPKRSIVAPPSGGVLEVDHEPIANDRNLEGTQSVSSSGRAVETVLHRIEKFWQIRTAPIPRANYDQWQEFADSVAAGETFTLDLYGTQAAPADPQTVRLEFNSFREEPLGSMYFVFSFKVRR